MIIVRGLFKIIPDSHLHDLKAALLRWAGVSVGKNLEIFSSAKILGNMTLEIGDNCFIGNDALIMGAKGSTIILEDFSKISTRTIIVTGTHIFSAEGNCVVKEGIFKDIRICAGASAGIGSIILPGVTVGSMAFVGAGAVVSRDVPPYALVTGVPAKFIKDFRNEEVAL